MTEAQSASRQWLQLLTSQAMDAEAQFLHSFQRAAPDLKDYYRTVASEFSHPLLTVSALREEEGGTGEGVG
jgi:ABC-type taurine transport system substrate-binding protein